jgi:hypothetical protein
LILSPPILNHNIAAIDETGIAKALAECRDEMDARLERAIVEKPDHRHRRLLRPRRARPRRRYATECCDKVAPPHGQSLRCEDHTLPHRRKTVLCITAFWPTRLPQRVKNGADRQGRPLPNARIALKATVNCARIVSPSITSVAPGAIGSAAPAAKHRDAASAGQVHVGARDRAPHPQERDGATAAVIGRLGPPKRPKVPAVMKRPVAHRVRRRLRR